MGWGRAKVGPCRRSRAGCLSAVAADPSGSCGLLFVNSEGRHSLSRGWRPGRSLCSLWNGVHAPPLTPASPSHQVVNQMLDRTSSGNFAGNEGFTYMTLTSLPFSGVGEPCPPSPSSPNSQGSPSGHSRPRKVQFGLHSWFNLDPGPWSLRALVSLSAKWLIAWPGLPAGRWAAATGGRLLGLASDPSVPLQAKVGWEGTMASSPSTPSPTTAPACSPTRAWRCRRTSSTHPILTADRSCSPGPWAATAAPCCEHPARLQVSVHNPSVLLLPGCSVAPKRQASCPGKERSCPWGFV